MKTTESLARFVSEYDTRRIPDAVRHQAIRSLVNWAGCALGGARHPAVENALAAFRPFIGPAQASILGRPERVDALHAALFNGISSHVLDFDDTHLATLVHPSGPVLSALLAFAQYHPIDGKTFVDAIVFGIEVECRVAMGVGPAHYDAGWHVTGTAGGFGAAAAVGRALKLDAKLMAWAFGIVATQAAGLREMFGTMCKSLHPGRAAQSGLSAVLLARAGFTSSSRAIEAPRGFAHVLSSDPQLADATSGLGEQWQTLANSFKPYACGVVIHPIIDGCLALSSAQAYAPDEIEQVALQVHPLVLELTGKTQPLTGLEGKFSVFHSAAIALLKGSSTAWNYSDQAVRDPAVIALRERVTAQPQAGMREDEARITIRLKNGQTIAHHVEHALGSLERPMSDSDLSGKFKDLARDIWPAGQMEEALALCWRADTLADAGEIGNRLAAP
ncbi:MmgE/PrpD family protein [Pollutimonas bauzanensis]|uniref:2-methylcitrate dehydratase PrpD n=1 Tax=Pollutimonas bauzanensis TaxID=658167 RepID=A0A1M5UYG0_9BURK|nr:MmgE/PrpD family protein [Pollutimonas bauzanensis]SHH67956.1 2-methylcitrate dehydratase PrpD [Pollutimonas bauzanensis]